METSKENYKSRKSSSIQGHCIHTLTLFNLLVEFKQLVQNLHAEIHRSNGTKL